MIGTDLVANRTGADLVGATLLGADLVGGDLDRCAAAVFGFAADFAGVTFAVALSWVLADLALVGRADIALALPARASCFGLARPAALLAARLADVTLAGVAFAPGLRPGGPAVRWAGLAALLRRRVLFAMLKPRKIGLNQGRFRGGARAPKAICVLLLMRRPNQVKPIPATGFQPTSASQILGFRRGCDVLPGIRQG